MLIAEVYMKKLFLSFAIAFALTSGAQAKTPTEVLEPYKAYRAELKAGDHKAAMKSAYEAWQKAEELMGDSKTTGDLAVNYADLATKLKGKNVEDAYERSIELASLYTEAAVETRLTREVKYGEYGIKIGKLSKLKKRLKKAVEFAEANGAGMSTYTGELYTMLAQLEVKSGDHDDTEIYADKALNIFAETQDGIVTYHPFMATLYSGYGKEGQKDFVPALMQYQKIMENTEGGLPRDHPFVMRALGRWMTMRNRIKREGLTQEAEAAGMCACWPYDKKRNEAVRPVKRVPGLMPRRAYQSGFAIVEFDLADDGGTLNPRVLEGWPKDMFDKSALAAVKKWEYTPRTSDETDEDRKDIITTMWYRLTDRNGDLIE